MSEQNPPAQSQDVAMRDEQSQDRGENDKALPAAVTPPPTHQHWTSALAADLAADESHAPPPVPVEQGQEPVYRIKPLEWRVESTGCDYLATGAGFTYEVVMLTPTSWRLNFGLRREFSSLDAAKAAAEAHYRQRLLSALTPVPAVQGERQAPEPAGDVVERAAKLAGINDHCAKLLHACVLGDNAVTARDVRGGIDLLAAKVVADAERIADRDRHIYALTGQLSAALATPGPSTGEERKKDAQQ